MKDKNSPYDDIDTITSISLMNVRPATENMDSNNLKFYRINLYDEFRNLEVSEAFYLPVANSLEIAIDAQDQKANLFISDFYISPNANIMEIEAEARRRLSSIKYSSWDEFYDEISKIFFHDLED